MTNDTLLIADIGGTNARFALASETSPYFASAMTLTCADYPSADVAMRHYLESVSAPEPDVICLAAAGPVVDGRVNITNNHWALSVAELAADFGIESVRLLNDFEAVAYAIPSIAGVDCEAIGEDGDHRLPKSDFRVAIVGPGTGLGVAGLYRSDGSLIPIVGEGGHVGFAPRSRRQTEILDTLHTRFDVIPIERVLSGSGVENIYWALGVLQNEERERLDAAAIFQRANEQSDERAAETINVFFELLGQVAGDVVLTFGARDGLYIAGGIVRRYPELLRASGFRASFENKGSHEYYMQGIPTRLITHGEPGLLGAAVCAIAMRGH